jgi:hypothetical protein
MATTPIPIPQQQQSGMSADAYMQALQAQAAQQANTTGLTQVAPSTSGAQAPAQRQFPAQQQMSNRTFGPGEGAARKRESMQNLVKTTQNLASQFGQMVQQRQQRQYEQTISRFTGATTGVAQSQAQVMQGQQMQQQAVAALKQNPQDTQARQMLQQAQQMVQGGSSALKQNQNILNDLANDKKSHKVITKAFGIDDKNANTPERQAAMKVLQDQSRPNLQTQTQTSGTTIPAQQGTVQTQAQPAYQQSQLVNGHIATSTQQGTPAQQMDMGSTPAQQVTPGQTQTVQGQGMPPGLGQQAAGIMSQLPQTQQLTPQAQAQQMARQAGIVGAPATGGQLLNAESAANRNATTSQNNEANQTIKAEALAAKVGLDTDKLVASLPNKGMKAVKNEDGTYKRDANGELVTANLTHADLENNPALSEKWEENRAKINLQVAQAQATTVRARIAQMAEQRKRAQLLQVSQPGSIQTWASALADPSTGVTLSNVPSAARGAVLAQMTRNGQRLSKPLTGDEIKRADLATNANSNIEAAQAILAKRPDMFGPSGWGKTKFEMAVAGGDPDAIDFVTDMKLANLPAVGVHGVRGKYAIEDLSRLDSNLYLNKDSMGAVLTDIHRSTTEFSKSGGRQSPIPSASGGGFNWGALPASK